MPVNRYLNTLLAMLGRAGVDDFDAILCDPQYGYTPERESLMTELQRTQSGPWRYFFLRSELHLDRLTPEEQLRLQLDADLTPLVASTLIRVAKIIPESPDGCEVFLDDTGTAALNCSLVLGIAASPAFDKNGMIIDREAEGRRRAMLQELAKAAAPMIAGTMGLIPVTVLVL